jgi:hypothetical protein
MSDSSNSQEPLPRWSGDYQNDHWRKELGFPDDQEGRLLLQEVWDALDQSERWPTFGLIDRAFYRKYGVDVSDVIARVPPTFLLGGRPQGGAAPADDGELALTVAGAGLCSGADRVLNVVVTAARLGAAAYLSHDPAEPSVSFDQVVAEIGDYGLSEDGLRELGRRSGMLLLQEPWRSHSNINDGRWTFQVDRAIRKYAGVRNVGEYWTARQHQVIDQASASWGFVEGGDVSVRAWVTTKGELQWLRLMNAIGDEGELDAGDNQAYIATGGDNELSAAWDELRRRGLVEQVPVAGFMSKKPAIGPDSPWRLSARGAEAYRDRLEEGRSPAARRWGVRGALLDWLMTIDDDQFHDCDGFLADPRAVINGRQAADAAEVQAAAVYLRDRGLVEGMGPAEFAVMKLRITSDGRDVIDHYDGDVSAWVRRHEGNSATRITVGGDYITNSSHIQTMRNSPGSHQAQDGSTITAAESTEVASFITAVRKLVDAEDLPDQQRNELAGLVGELDQAAKTEDRGKIRRAWARARGALSGAGPTLNYFMTNLLLPAVFEDKSSAESEG